MTKFFSSAVKAVTPQYRSLSGTTNPKFFIPQNTKKLKAVLYLKRQNEKVAEVFYIKNSGRVNAVEILDEKVKSEQDISKHLDSYDYKRSLSDNKYKEVLAAIDPEAWHKFLDLLNPVAVFNLGLRKSPNKISFYNFCIPAVENASDLNSEQNQRVIRNMSKTMALFPVIFDIYSIDREFGNKLLKMIKGESDRKQIVQNFKNYLKIPQATNGFLKCIGHTNRSDLVRILDGFLREGLTNSEGKFNDKIYNYRVASLPTHHDEERYNGMWRVVDSLSASNLSQRTKSLIFLNSRSNFVTEAENAVGCIGNLLPQYSTAIADDLLLPVYFEEFHRQFFKKFQTSTKLLEKFEDGFVDHVRAILSNFVNDKMISTLTPQKIWDGFKKLDRMTSIINESKPLLFGRDNSGLKRRWHKLFPDMERDGYKFRVLDKGQDLHDEADKMKNCLKSFNQRCSAGVCHIVSIEAPDGKRFSMRINQYSKGVEGLKIDEINSAGNGFEVNEVTPVAESVFKDIETGKIPIIAESGLIEKDFTISEFLGFDVSKKEDVRSVFEAYRDAHIMPRNLIGSKMDLEQFYDSIELKEYIAAKVAQDIALVESPSAKLIPKFVRKAVSPNNKSDCRLNYDL